MYVNGVITQSPFESGCVCVCEGENCHTYLCKLCYNVFQHVGGCLVEQRFQSRHVHTLGQDILQSTLRLSTHTHTERGRAISKAVPTLSQHVKVASTSHNLTYHVQAWNEVRDRARGRCVRGLHASHLHDEVL